SVFAGDGKIVGVPQHEFGGKTCGRDKDLQNIVVDGAQLHARTQSVEIDVSQQTSQYFLQRRVRATGQTRFVARMRAAKCGFASPEIASLIRATVAGQARIMQWTGGCHVSSPSSARIDTPC